MNYKEEIEKAEYEDSKEFFLANIYGTYITDIVKGLPTANSGVLNDNIEKVAEAIGGKNNIDNFRKKLANLFVDMLIEELKLLGNITHTLVIMGTPSHSFSRKPNEKKGKNISGYDFINEMLKDGDFEEKYKKSSGHVIKKIPVRHYSASGSSAIYREQLEKAFNKYEGYYDEAGFAVGIEYEITIRLKGDWSTSETSLFIGSHFDEKDVLEVDGSVVKVLWEMPGYGGEGDIENMMYYILVDNKLGDYTYTRVK